MASLGCIVEGEQADEKNHREADAAQDRDSVELSRWLRDPAAAHSKTYREPYGGQDADLLPRPSTIPSDRGACSRRC